MVAMGCRTGGVKDDDISHGGFLSFWFHNF